MTVAAIHRQSVQQLQLLYPIEEARALSYALLQHCSSFSRTHLYAFPDTELPEETVARIQSGITDLLAHRPLQYILGETFFCGHPIEVTDAVLIPRPETEELVQWVIRSREWKAGHVLVDLCTGSGCIAIALAAAAPGATVFACDISPEALAVAQRNALKNGTDVHFFHCDVLSAKEWNGTADAIICNPPYVRLCEKIAMKENVLRYEPPEALFVSDDDPLVFYRAVVRLARRHLRKGGLLFVEINEALGRETADVLRSAGLTSVELRKDIHGKDRMIKAGL